MKIEFEHNQTASLGEIITILKDGNPVARLRQIGKRSPASDVRLEWLEWEGNRRIEHAIQFPMCTLSEVTPEHIQQMVMKYNL
jgi:antitoxin (DNA-binding transcriptional repressor) of toxin-antitoxin stability system